MHVYTCAENSPAGLSSRAPGRDMEIDAGVSFLHSSCKIRMTGALGCNAQLVDF